MKKTTKTEELKRSSIPPQANRPDLETQEVVTRATI
jgi:hypothetical protein